MSISEQNIRWADEFKDFMKEDEVIPPRIVSERVQELISRKLNPAPERVFLKMATIHLVVGTINLIFCPQFGFSFTKGMGLMKFLMPFGHLVCSIGCGAFFIGTGLFFVSILLSPEEMKVFRRSRIIQVAILSVLSAGVFLFFGAPVLQMMTLAWLMGAILGGVFSLELGQRLRWLIMHR